MVTLPEKKTYWFVPGTGFAKKLCLHFDDVTMFTQPQHNLFVKLAKWGTPGPALSRCNRSGCIGSSAMVLGRLFIFVRHSSTTRIVKSLI